MKKLFIMLLAGLMLLSAAACTVKKTGDPSANAVIEPDGKIGTDEQIGQEIAGGWTDPKSTQVTEEIKALFEKGMEELVGVNYVPVAYLGSQVVAGTNHRVLAKATVVVPDAVPHYAIVTLWEKLDGTVEVTDIRGSEIEVLVSDEQLAGGWSAPETPDLDDDIKAIVEKATAELVGVGYSPVALLGTQVVAGMNYQVLCKATPVTANPETRYVVLTVYADLEGNATVTDVAEFESAAE